MTHLLQLTDIHASLLTKVHTFQIRSLSPDAPLEPEIPTEHLVLTSPGPSGLGELPQSPCGDLDRSEDWPGEGEPRTCVSSHSSLSLVLVPRVLLRLFPQEFRIPFPTSVTGGGGALAAPRGVVSGRSVFLSVNTGCLYVCLCLWFLS